MARKMHEEGLCFSCVLCHACCRHQAGYVFLSAVDVKGLCQNLQLSEQDFFIQYTRLVRYHSVYRLSLIEKTNYDCIFWDKGCSVYEDRPFQCKSYPFWSSVLSSKEAWQQEASACPGINQGQWHSGSEIQSLLDRRSEEPFLVFTNVPYQGMLVEEEC